MLVSKFHAFKNISYDTPSCIQKELLTSQNICSKEVFIQEVQKWLDESKDGCIYFTFGSMVRIETFPKEMMQQIYKSFEKIAPVRVLMKVAKKEDLLPGLPKNVMTQSWFPQKSILST